MKPRRFVIGDIHGCALTMQRLVQKGIGLTKTDELYLLGDLIDRGPDSKGVLDFILEQRVQGFTIVAVRGNHEEMFLHAGDSSQDMYQWLLNGGQATLANFEADGPGDIPHRYRFFLSSLPYYLLLDDFVIVHAGLNFDRSDPFSDTEAMLWQRDCEVDLSRTGGRRLVCGHTPVTREQLEASLSSDRIMLDNGCVFSSHSRGGSLAALELNSMQVVYQENIDLAA
jgi:serine/threonine protein phosphatase 1